MIYLGSVLQIYQDSGFNPNYWFMHACSSQDLCTCARSNKFEDWNAHIFCSGICLAWGQAQPWAQVWFRRSPSVYSGVWLWRGSSVWERHRSFLLGHAKGAWIELCRWYSGRGSMLPQIPQANDVKRNWLSMRFLRDGHSSQRYLICNMFQLWASTSKTHTHKKGATQGHMMIQVFAFVWQRILRSQLACTFFWQRILQLHQAYT